ncbi:MAG: LamG-like jellyroll fold domain-containing protein, partial [Candidatus Heimdallarchaeota archaeon]
VYSFNNSFENSYDSNAKGDELENDEISPTETPQMSIFGQDSGWNGSFFYRKVINITNPHDIALTDHGTFIEIDYLSMVTDGNMQDDMDDVRIVENGILRNYYIQKDYPSAGKALIWFETNVSSAPSTEIDTYLYYGNDTVSRAESYYMDELFGTTYYGFEEGSGDLLQDTSGVNNGTLRNGATWDAGVVGTYSGAFDGSNDYVNIQEDNSMDFDDARYSVSAWVKTRDGDGSGMIIAKSDDASNLLDGWGLGMGTGCGGATQPGEVVFRHRNSNNGMDDKVYTDNFDEVGDGKWHHIVWTSDNGYPDIKLYVDGEEKTVVYWRSDGCREANSNYRASIGGHIVDTELFLDSLIDEIRIFDYAISGTQVDWLYSLNYTLQTVLNEEHPKKANIKVNALDINDNPISEAIISIYNESSPFLPFDTITAGSDGSATFSNLDTGLYNFSVKIESDVNPGYFELVNRTTQAYLLEALSREINLTCTVGSHFFNVIDIDGAPLESGWIVVGNNTHGQIENCSIDETGQTTFQWLDDGYPYNYTVYYQDNDFNEPIVELANGTIDDTYDTPIIVWVNFTTVNFTIIETGTQDPVSGVSIELYKQNSGESIVNLTTNEQGSVILRWFNSSGFSQGEIVNYTVKVVFFEDYRLINKTTGGIPEIYEYNITLSSKADYEFRFTEDLSKFTTEILSMNPTDDIEIEWGSELTLRALFNVTGAGAKTELLGPAYASSMTYEIIKGITVIDSGSLDGESGNEGKHQATINTGAGDFLGGQTYKIDITAQKAGFTIPEKLTLLLTVLKNELLLNQSQNDDSDQEVYWLEEADMSVKAYGTNSEIFVIENSIYKEADNNEYNFDLELPGISNDLNLSYVVFNIYNITYGTIQDYTYLTIRDDYGGSMTLTGSGNPQNQYFYSPGASNGTWYDLVYTLDKRSIDNDNKFKFKIEGNHSGNIDIVADAYFSRNTVNIQYTNDNITNLISIPSDGNGWVIKNITFQISNCRLRSDWSLVNPSVYIDNITTNEGHDYLFVDGAADGTGSLTIDNNMIYPLDENFLFTIGNNSEIAFNVLIQVEYIQLFYQNIHLEQFTIRRSSPNFSNATYIEFNLVEYDWANQGATLYVYDLKDQSSQFALPADVEMNITIDGTTYFFEEYGSLSLDNLDINTLYSATIRANQTVSFNLRFRIDFLRTVFFTVTGTVTYEIRESPNVYGIVPYNPTLEHYNQTIDTSLINSGSYTVRFTATKEHYSEAIIDLNLIVEERVTLLNGNSRDPTNIIATIYVKDSVNFTFTFWDRDLDLLIEDLD